MVDVFALVVTAVLVLTDTASSGDYVRSELGPARGVFRSTAGIPVMRHRGVLAIRALGAALSEIV